MARRGKSSSSGEAVVWVYHRADSQVIRSMASQPSRGDSSLYELMDWTLPYHLSIIQVEPWKFINAYVLNFDEFLLSPNPFLGLVVGSNNAEP